MKGFHKSEGGFPFEPEELEGYPKKKEIPEVSLTDAVSYEALENRAYNQCRDQMTQEIKKRADVGEIMATVDKTCGECRAFSDRRLCGVQKGYICIDIAKAISTHITEGLEE